MNNLKLIKIICTEIDNKLKGDKKDKEFTYLKQYIKKSNLLIGDKKKIYKHINNLKSIEK